MGNIAKNNKRSGQRSNELVKKIVRTDSWLEKRSLFKVLLDEQKKNIFCQSSL
jgi:hypothetical protein